MGVWDFLEQISADGGLWCWVSGVCSSWVTNTSVLIDEGNGQEKWNFQCLDSEVTLMKDRHGKR